MKKTAFIENVNCSAYMPNSFGIFAMAAILVRANIINNLKSKCLIINS